MDPVAKAVAAAEAAKQEYSVIGLNLPTGRVATLSVPEDLTLQEAAALAMHVGGFIHRVLEAAEERRKVAATPQVAGRLHA